MVLGAVMMLSMVGLSDPAISQRLDEEIARLRRELDQLEQRWAEATTECRCGRGSDFVQVLSSLARPHSRQTKSLRVESIDTGDRARSLGRRVFRVHVQSSFPALCEFLQEVSRLKMATIVDRLRLRRRDDAVLDVSFRLVVYDDVTTAVALGATP